MWKLVETSASDFSTVQMKLENLKKAKKFKSLKSMSILKCTIWLFKEMSSIQPQQGATVEQKQKKKKKNAPTEGMHSSFVYTKSQKICS